MNPTVDGSQIRRSPVEGTEFIPLFSGFYTSQVVQDFFQRVCHLKKDHVRRKLHLPTINFQGIFFGGYIPENILMGCPLRQNMFAVRVNIGLNKHSFAGDKGLIDHPCF